MLSTVQTKSLSSTEDLSRLREQLLTMTPRSKTSVKVHLGTCGISAGASEVWEKFREELRTQRLEGRVTIHKAGCIGMCSVEPNVTVTSPSGEIVIYKKITPEIVPRILEEHIADNRLLRDYVVDPNDQYLKSQVRRVLRNQDIDPTRIEDYFVREGYSGLAKVLNGMSPDDVIVQMEKSGLRGRGGAGFRTGLKWKRARASQGEQKYVVCDADEGDPGAYMNRAILEGNPHSIIEGMAIAGYAIGASRGYIYVRAEYPIAVETLEHAIRQARQYGLLGTDILGTRFSFDVEICLGAGAFVCGEETALLASLMGKRGSPRRDC